MNLVEAMTTHPTLAGTLTLIQKLQAKRAKVEKEPPAYTDRANVNHTSGEDPWHFEVRLRSQGGGAWTVARCVTRDEAEAIADAINLAEYARFDTAIAEAKQRVAAWLNTQLITGGES